MNPGALTALDAEDRARFGWTSLSPAAPVMAALEARARGGSRFVGGCVRDSLRGQSPKDIDIATILKPDEVEAALAAAGLKSAPTGVDYGTITGIADRRGVEITTLRADVTTDGRRAVVAFTRDWAVDAGRRDFRLNAIYLTPDLQLFDPVGGVADAKADAVRFIGAADDRIREDYLRILRFFRFSARFAGGFDAQGLAACAACAGGLKRLSAERIGDEFSRLLALPQAALAIDAMWAAGVLEEVWSAAPRRAIFRRLKDRAPDAPPPLGLAALFGADGEGIDSALRLSSALAHRRKRALKAAEQMRPDLDERAARAHLHRLDADAWRDGVLLFEAETGRDWPALATLPDRNPPPDFPLRGKHVVAAGVPPGPRVAKILKAIEDQWVAEDFPARERLDAMLKERCSE
jgi:poly(A) polymerase